MHIQRRMMVAAGTTLGLAWQPGLAQTAGPAPATPAPAAPARAAPAERDEGEVLVIAEHGDQQAIDRKSYAVRQGPAAEIATGIDVMRDLPSVSVDAAGQIELLGNRNVRILIDGRPMPDALSVLRSMNAAQIARIEVMTNPPAQFSAEGTAGIINVITRRSSRDGLGGTIASGVDTRGGGILRVAPTWTKGRWSLSTSPTLFAQRNPTSSTLERQQLSGPPDGVSNRNEVAEGRQRADGFGSRTQLVYRPDATRSFSAALNSSRVDVANDQRNRVTARNGEFDPFEQRSSVDGSFRAGNLSMDYRAEGDKPGELFTVATSGTIFSFDNDIVFHEAKLAGGPAATLAVGTRFEDKQATLKLDYATPITKTRRLSAGANLDWRRRRLTDRAVGGGLLGPIRNQASDYAGEYTEAAAYVTYQMMLGGWKLLPGLRVQARDYSLDGPGADGPSDVRPFPSLFVERKLSKKLTGVISYSRRISWPDIADLSPVLRLQSPTFGIRGDPELDPETTDAFEGRVSYAGTIHSFDLTLYNRITRDTFDRRILLQPDGLVVSSPVNAGRRTDQGLEAAFRGRVAKPLRYSLTGNLTAVERNVGAIGTRRRDAQYRGKLQLDYTQGKAADPGFDQLTFNLRYEGPVREFQTRRDDFIDADLTWTHRFTPRLSLVTSATALFGGIRIDGETRTPFILERRRQQSSGRTVRMTLTYQLGATPQQQPQPQAPVIPSVPIP